MNLEKNALHADEKKFFEHTRTGTEITTSGHNYCNTNESPKFLGVTVDEFLNRGKSRRLHHLQTTRSELHVQKISKIYR